MASARPAAFFNPAGLHDPRPNAYSHVAVAEAPARFIYVAGQGGRDAKGRLRPDFAGQVQQALHNLITALTAAGAGVADVVKMTVLIVDHSEAHLPVLSRALSETWGPWPGPVSTLIPVPRLAVDGMLFEIEAIAVAPLKRRAGPCVF